MKTSVACGWSVPASRTRLTTLALLLICLVVPPIVSADGLASIQLKSYYQPEPVQMAPVEKAWNLPLAWNNVSNDSRASWASVLSSNAMTALDRNGFVVVSYGRATNVNDFYGSLAWAGLPFFVTSDSLMHLYHVQFDDILKCVETNTFLPRLVVMTDTLLQESLQQRALFTNDLQEAATRNAVFLTVAARLMGQNPTVPAEVGAVADEELTLINAHGGFSASPLFHYAEDYSQYVPRGHYTRSETLKQYFKAMMWYGRLAFLLKGSNNYGPAGDALVSIQDAKVQTLQAVLLTLGLDRLQAEGQPIADTWNRIYAVTAFFVGLADDLTPYEYRDVLLKLFGTGVKAEDIAGEQELFLLKRQLASLRNPEIYGGTGNCQVPPNATPEELQRVLDKTKGMRVMGQRFIPDSYMFQQLVFPAVGSFVGTGQPFTMAATQAGPKRCFPRGLDVMAVLGSQLALNVLDKEGDTAYLGFDDSMNDLMGKFTAVDTGTWHRNLYWGWLYALRSLLTPCSSVYPAFMQTPAWQAKQLNTALASWAELRHDTILYAKQSTTVVATSGPPPRQCGYAEPVPEFYQRLLSLTRMTRSGLDDLQVLDVVQRNRLLALENILVSLRDIAVAELESRPLTATQTNFLTYFDRELSALTNGIPGGAGLNTTLIADVHTDPNTSKVLEEAVGYLKLMVVAVPRAGGGLTIAAGPVMSYYEFKWAMNDRFTDERWEVLASYNRIPAPAWTSAFVEPIALPPEDADGDRLPDAWEQIYWGNSSVANDRNADADGDGMTNWQEAIVGTDPTDPNSCLRLNATPTGMGNVELRWSIVAGRTYRVRCSEDLQNWRLLGVPVAGIGPTATVTDSSTNCSSARFYRLEVIP